jgi:DNA-binding HxlR family transcriptional regulator
MKIITNDLLPGKVECANSLKNVLDALYVLNGKWKLALILSLVQAPKRFNEIQHEITGISSKVLANELKDLELNDFVTRNVYPTTPVSVIYEATAYSRTLKNVLGELSAWGEQQRKSERKYAEAVLNEGV